MVTAFDAVLNNDEVDTSLTGCEGMETHCGTLKYDRLENTERRFSRKNRRHAGIASNGILTGT